MLKLCVLTKWDFNFCVRSSPLRGGLDEGEVGGGGGGYALRDCRCQNDSKFRRTAMWTVSEMGNPDYRHVTMFDIHIRRLLGMYCPRLAGIRGNDRDDTLSGKAATVTTGLRLGRSGMLRSSRRTTCRHKNWRKKLRLLQLACVSEDLEC